VQKTLCGPVEDIVVGQSIVTVPTPAGPVEILVATAQDDEVEFHLDGSPEALAYVNAEADLLVGDPISSGKEAA